jgi:uncharacterized glyoxalase superfamily protein PhnB
MIIPTLRYTDIASTIDFLQRAFGLELRPGGTPEHSELTLGRGMVMVGTRKPGDRFETGRAVLYGIVDDPDAVHDRAKAAGATIVMDLVDQPYGSREFAAEDPEGNIWSFGTYDPFAT